MKNRTAKKSIVMYWILALALTLPFLIPLWCIDDTLGLLIYFICFFIYVRIAVSFVVRVTIMPSLWKELDAEKFAAIINAKPFLANYSYKLNLYFATGDYQSAYNVINSVFLQNKHSNQKVYGHLLLCRICLERGDYEGIKDNIAQIDNYLKYDPTLKLSKHNKTAYEFFRAFSVADYASACAIAERSIDEYSKKKNRDYFIVMRKYQLAVTKRMNGELDEAASLFEEIEKKAPKLAFSALSRKQSDIISGRIEEEAPSKLEITEKVAIKMSKARRVILRMIIILFCVAFALMIFSTIMEKINAPKQENKNPEHIANIENAIEDDYNDHEILGYVVIYEDEACTISIDSLFLIRSNGKLDLHTLYREGEKIDNHLNVSDIQVDKIYEYDNIFSPKKIKFVLTEKERDIPESTTYCYEVDGYYFCVISISES